MVAYIQTFNSLLSVTDFPPMIDTCVSSFAVDGTLEEEQAKLKPLIAPATRDIYKSTDQ